MSPDSEPARRATTGHRTPALTRTPAGTEVGSESTKPGRSPDAASSLGRVVSRTPPAAGWRFAFSSLGNRDFLLLWLGLLFMMGGVQMQMIARSYLVYEMTGSARILGLVSAAGGLPMLALALFGGAVADRFERRSLIQVGQVTLAVIALSVGISIAIGTISWVQLMVAAILQGIVWPFVVPARQALIPQLVGREKLSNAVALQGAGMSVTTLTAPAVAGVLYAAIGPEGVYYVITAMALISLGLTALISKPAGGERSSKSRMLGDIRDGLSYVWSNKLVMVLMVVALATIVLAMPIRFLLPIFVTDIYHRESEAFGLLMSAVGVGSLAGSLFVASLGKWRRGLLLILGCFASGVALLLVALVPLYFAAAGFMVLLGLGEAARRTLNLALVMERVDDEYQGRVMSLLVMSFGLMPLGVLPAGFAMDLLGPEKTVGIMGGAMLAVAVVVLLSQKKLRALQ